MTRKLKTRFLYLLAWTRRAPQLLLALTLAGAFSFQCTTTDPCQEEEEQATLCSLTLLDYARACTQQETAAGRSTSICNGALFGSVLICPLTVSETCR